MFILESLILATILIFIILPPINKIKNSGFRLEQKHKIIDLLIIFSILFWTINFFPGIFVNAEKMFGGTFQYVLLAYLWYLAEMILICFLITLMAEGILKSKKLSEVNYEDRLFDSM